MGTTAAATKPSITCVWIGNSGFDHHGWHGELAWPPIMKTRWVRAAVAIDRSLRINTRAGRRLSDTVTYPENTGTELVGKSSASTVRFSSHEVVQFDAIIFIIQYTRNTRLEYQIRSLRVDQKPPARQDRTSLGPSRLRGSIETDNYFSYRWAGSQPETTYWLDNLWIYS